MSDKRTIIKKTVKCTMDQLSNFLRDMNLKKRKHNPKFRTVSEYESMSEDEEDSPDLELTDVGPIFDPKDFNSYPEGYFWEWHKGRYWTKSGEKQAGKWWSIWWPRQRMSSTSSSTTAPPELFKWFANTDHWY